MEGLFAGGPTFDLCRRFGWKFMIVLKDDDLPSINEEFDALSKLQSENRLVWRTGKGAQIKQAFRWADDIAYVDSEKKEHTLSAIECLETKPDKEGQKKTTKFKWVTNYHVSCKNITILSNEGGRVRWKIENEGFTYKKREDTNWSTLTLITLTRPRSFTSSCRSLICWPNFSTRQPCSKGISLMDSAQQKTWPSDYSKPGEMPAWLKQTSGQCFKNDFKFALIPLDPSAAPVLSSLTI